MNRVELEPGLIITFRLFSALWLGLSLLQMGLQVLFPAMTGETWQFYFSNVANLAILLLYLHTPRLAHYLKRGYLPGAILLASAVPMMIRYIFPPWWFGAPENVGSRLIVQLVLPLFLPLTISAWQYDFRRVLLFSLSLAAVDIILVPSVSQQAGYSTGVIFIIIWRTFSFLMVGYMVTRIMTTQRAQRQSLAEANTQLTHYAAILEHLATTRERNRLARELHDTLVHTLSAVAVQQEAINTLWADDPAQAQALLAQALHNTRTGLTETRRALQALRSTPLDDFGLALALERAAQTVAERANLELELHIVKQEYNLPPDVEQCYYRVAQEALANVLTTRRRAALK